MVTSAARISMGWLSSDLAKARAVPWNVPRTDTGTPSPATAFSMAAVASESATLGDRLKLMVEAGVPLWWLTESGVLVSSSRAKLESGMRSPRAFMKNRLRRVSGLCRCSGASSITTRYWLSGL